jgi:excisionase family DNA binding protein
MSAAGAEIARLVIEAARTDAALAADLAAVIGPLMQHGPAPAGWMTTRQAAVYLGLTRAALHRLTAARAVPFEQEVPGGKCWFNSADLDAWRRGGSVASHRRSVV